MLPNRRDAAALWDIGKAARLIREFIADRDQQSFSETPMCHFAVIAQLQIIGEATKRLSTPFREAHPAIPWREMAGMRDILIHLYDRVDLNEVWLAATESIPNLLDEIEPLLDEGLPGNGPDAQPSGED